jgi:hypothetical protein
LKAIESVKLTQSKERTMGGSRFQGRQWSKAALGLLVALSGLWAASGLPAQAQRTTVFDLDQAICANDWRDAIGIVGTLIARDETTSAERSALLTLRRQLQSYQSENVIVADAQACDRTDPYLLQTSLPATVQTGQPLGWELAVAEATENQYSTEVITESTPLTLPVAVGELAGLTPAMPVDLSRGLNVVSGHVGEGHEVHAFVAGLGDRLEANLDVTRVMAGSLYTSDDSQLFIFDRQGNLIASADDSNEQRQSRINGMIVPRTDLYFAVVTSYNNDPILNREGRLTGWQDNGGGRFDYTLTLSGVTPTNALTR